MYEAYRENKKTLDLTAVQDSHLVSELQSLWEVFQRAKTLAPDLFIQIGVMTENGETSTVSTGPMQPLPMRAAAAGDALRELGLKMQEVLNFKFVEREVAY